jgi:hypothetical protein
MSTSSAIDRSSTNDVSLAVEDTKKHRQPGVVPVPTDKAGQTTPAQAEDRVPRLPHEHDESADSQAGEAGELPSAEHSRQAFDDVERGLVNTDRGLEGNTLVNDAPLSGKKKRDNPQI